MRIASKVYAAAIASGRALDLDLGEYLSELGLCSLSLSDALYARKEYKA
jgi:hypothetical protein